jgi:hypothetical protein
VGHGFVGETGPVRQGFEGRKIQGHLGLAFPISWSPVGGAHVGKRKVVKVDWFDLRSRMRQLIYILNG